MFKLIFEAKISPVEKKTVWDFKTRIRKIAQELKTKSHPNLNNLNSNQDFAFDSRFEIDINDFKPMKSIYQSHMMISWASSIGIPLNRYLSKPNNLFI